MNTYCNRRNKSYYRKYILFHRKNINFISQDKYFLWKMSSRDRKFFFLWKQISSRDKIFLLVTEKFVLCQEISSCDKKFLQKTGNFFQCHESSYTQFLFEEGTLFWWQELSAIFYSIWYKKKWVKITQLCRYFKVWWKITHICHDFISDLFLLFQANIFTGKLGSHEISNFLPRWWGDGKTLKDMTEQSVAKAQKYIGGGGRLGFVSWIS